MGNVATDRVYLALADAVIELGLGSNQKIVHFVTDWDQDAHNYMGVIPADLAKSFSNDPENLRIFLTVFDLAVTYLAQDELNDIYIVPFQNFRNEAVAYLHEITQNHASTG